MLLFPLKSVVVNYGFYEFDNTLNDCVLSFADVIRDLCALASLASDFSEQLNNPSYNLQKSQLTPNSDVSLLVIPPHVFVRTNPYLLNNIFVIPLFRVALKKAYLCLR